LKKKRRDGLRLYSAKPVLAKLWSQKGKKPKKSQQTEPCNVL